MRQKAEQLLLDIDRVKKNQLAVGIGKKTGLFDALDNIAALVVDLVERVESISAVMAGGEHGK